jgi:endonuclease YncB( thermonuclease family)
MAGRNKKLLLTLTLGLLASVTAFSEEKTTGRDPTRGCEITLDGQAALVNFNDGDTFKILEGNNRNTRVRITGFNALETQPVHSWGNASFEYLYHNSQEATQVAKKGGWHCATKGERDTYGRLIAECDDLALELIAMGLAHAYSVDSQPAKRSYLRAQEKAQHDETGMWRYGIPQQIITSLHSADEGAQRTYDRAVSTKNGASELIQHDHVRRTCELVCIEEGFSCMIYVPFRLRYGAHKPECLRVSNG